MPRKARIDAAGVLHHIIARGIERRKIFIDDQDRYDFLERIGPILEQTQAACYAWALMPNHFHLLLRTGSYPVATVMRRLLTGYAAGFNRRHCRHGHLFQNRYKSILCQEDAYFLELVRYIHLNPLRARLVNDLDALNRYPFSGHSALLGRHEQAWQHTQAVLSHFSPKAIAARKHYLAFVAKGIDQGKRPELTGGGLVRSAGGWSAVSAMRKADSHMKSDERILGDGDFVAQILAQANEALEKKYELKAAGIDIGYIAQRVAHLLDMPVEEVWLEGRYQKLVKARSLLCFWAVRELGMSMTALGRMLKISTVAVSKAVHRGAGIAAAEEYRLRIS
ncbi:MAG: transposase [Desulfobacteraceae bacterium]|nr:transposase [Desulfobacteraceae bacterium]